MTIVQHCYNIPPGEQRWLLKQGRTAPDDDLSKAAVGEQEESVKPIVSDEKNVALSPPHQNRKQHESIESPSPHVSGGAEMANDMVM